jgi:hypothetical protein
MEDKIPLEAMFKRLNLEPKPEVMYADIDFIPSSVSSSDLDKPMFARPTPHELFLKAKKETYAQLVERSRRGLPLFPLDRWWV